MKNVSPSTGGKPGFAALAETATQRLRPMARWNLTQRAQEDLGTAKRIGLIRDGSKLVRAMRTDQSQESMKQTQQALLLYVAVRNLVKTGTITRDIETGIQQAISTLKATGGLEQWQGKDATGLREAARSMGPSKALAQALEVVAAAIEVAGSPEAFWSTSHVPPN